MEIWKGWHISGWLCFIFYCLLFLLAQSPRLSCDHADWDPYSEQYWSKKKNKLLSAPWFRLNNVFVSALFLLLSVILFARNYGRCWISSTRRLFLPKRSLRKSNAGPTTKDSNICPFLIRFGEIKDSKKVDELRQVLQPYVLRWVAQFLPLQEQPVAILCCYCGKTDEIRCWPCFASERGDHHRSMFHFNLQ
jgi:hypothetical protein